MSCDNHSGHAVKQREKEGQITGQTILDKNAGNVLV